MAKEGDIITDKCPSECPYNHKGNEKAFCGLNCWALKNKNFGVTYNDEEEEKKLVPIWIREIELNKYDGAIDVTARDWHFRFCKDCKYHNKEDGTWGWCRLWDTLVVSKEMLCINLSIEKK